MREIEIKLRVKDFNTVEKKLAERGCALSLPITQHDVIYAEAGNTEIWTEAKEGHKCFRIRRLADSAELNLKIQRTREGDNLEFETEISDPDAADRMLQAIGHVPQVEVRKVRRKGRLDGYEICLDQVEELGAFIEFEKLVDDTADPVAVQKELFNAAGSLGLSRADEETRGYDTQIYALHHLDR